MSDVNLGDLREDWKEHGYTSVFRKSVEKEYALAESALVQACSTSADPKVRAAYERMKTAKLFAGWLKDGVP